MVSLNYKNENIPLRRFKNQQNSKTKYVKPVRNRFHFNSRFV